MTDQETVVSQEKFDEMVKELETLKTVRRTEIAKNLEYARSLGDLSENFDYEDAKRVQAVQKFLTAETAGRHIDFNVQVHDPAEKDMSAIPMGTSIQRRNASWTGC